jgi:hypothetical protein
MPIDQDVIGPFVARSPAVEEVGTRTRSAPRSADVVDIAKPAQRHVIYWPGASGRRYRHVVYDLLDCPPVGRTTYVLVAIKGDGTCRPLHVGLAQSSADVLNLAKIRHRGAKLGARQVHIMAAGASGLGARRIARDIQLGLLEN